MLEGTIKAVHDFVVVNGYRREGARERSFMYSLGVSTVPLDPKDEKRKYFCLSPAGCCQSMMAVLCEGGDLPTRTSNCCGLCTAMEKYPGYGYTQYPCKIPTYG